MKNSVSILIIIFVLTGVLGCGFGNRAGGAKDETNGAPDKPAVANKEESEAEKPVRSTEIVDAFRRDKAAANAKYKDKVILIRGKITNINDVFGVKALNLRDGEDAIGLQTYLANGADVEKVKVGDEVTVRGKVRGDALDVIDNAVIVEVN
ncbi:MAG TPA: hypothetical protein VIL74_24120 [Pyrinomonadaceae bacterium]|jgi:RecJ-like exonuclease